MSDPQKNATQKDEPVLLRTVERCSLVMTGLLSFGGWYIVDGRMALSILIGGMLSGCSFFLLKRTVGQILHTASAIGDPEHLRQIRITKGFATKFYARLIILGLLLAGLSMNVSINIIGLVIGLSIVAASVVVVATVYGCMELLGKHVKGV